MSLKSKEKNQKGATGTKEMVTSTRQTILTSVKTADSAKYLPFKA
jgi:hypothetical protein